MWGSVLEAPAQGLVHSCSAYSSATPFQSLSTPPPLLRSVVPRPAAADPGGLSGVHGAGPSPDLSAQHLHFKKSPSDPWAQQFEKP